MIDPQDPASLAARQRYLDGTRLRLVGLAERKRARMSASPLAFLRGSARLFYEIIAARPELGAGPEATGWIAGDLHVENFGAYRPAAAVPGDDDAEAARAVFDLNDFDDATIGPCRLDVLRLCTSLLLGTRDLALPGTTRTELGLALIEAHAAAIAGSVDAPEQPACVQALLDRVRSRTRKLLLDDRTLSAPDGRRFARGPRYQDVSMSLWREIPLAFSRYVASIEPRERAHAEVYEVVDAAFRIAGTGSLGCLRLAVLTRGKGGVDGGFIFDVKEQGEPSASVLFAPPALGPAARVRSAALALVSHPPRMLGETELDGVPCLGRRLAPQEDRLDWSAIHKSELAPLSRHLGWLTGRAHRRALTAPLAAPFSATEQAALLGRAITLAGLHEAAYLSYCA